MAGYAHAVKQRLQRLQAEAKLTASEQAAIVSKAKRSINNQPKSQVLQHAEQQAFANAMTTRYVVAMEAIATALHKLGKKL